MKALGHSLQFIEDHRETVMWSSKSTNLHFGFGIVFIIIGTFVIIFRLEDAVLDRLLATKLPLLNDTMVYNSWKSVQLEFHVYLFHVVNAKEVQTRGDVAMLAECGPYIYDELLERIPISVNESTDTIQYVSRRTFSFNAEKSGTLSEMDEITILNAAHLGSILMVGRYALRDQMENMMPAFLPQFGNSIPLLFSDPSSIFMQVRVKDILFDGVRVVCDTKVHKELNLICNVLRNTRPSTLRQISEEGVYAFSFFHRINATDEGPFTIFRGVKDKYATGYISEFKGRLYSDFWSIKNCSVVKGTDSIFWPPMSHRQPRVFTFLADICRSLWAEYSHDQVYNGLLGYYYRTSNSLWKDDDLDCYCPRLGDGTIACPPLGVLDMTKCQEVPVIMSEPHFVHGESSLFSIIKGLDPVEDMHATYIVIEPLTGVPLSGLRKIQLNVMLQQEPVHLLANVSNGIFPLLWIAEGLTPDKKTLAPVILLHRMRRLLGFSVWLPFIFGAFYVIHIFWMNPAATKCFFKTSGQTTIFDPIRNTSRN